MEERQEEHQELEQIQGGVEQPDLEALRDSYKGPSRWALRWERLSQFLKDQTLWTALLALAIVAVLVVGYLAMT